MAHTNFGIQTTRDQTWVMWVTLDGRRGNKPDIGWTDNPLNAWTGSEREAKALSVIVALTETHALRVKHAKV